MLRAPGLRLQGEESLLLPTTVHTWVPRVFFKAWL